MENQDVVEYFQNELKSQFEELEVEVDSHLEDEEEAYAKISLQMTEEQENDNQLLVNLLDFIRLKRNELMKELSIYLYINHKRIGKLPLNKAVWKNREIAL